ncbi:MAG: hypothetical protein JRF60_00445 [Deltaproteobacteria bacterium]|nr:hypothetical protein [Deltaproteobacteria bacterium]
MSKPKRTMKGATYRNGYWYARIDGHVKYCGKGDKGHKLTKTARMKWEVRMCLIKDTLPVSTLFTTTIDIQISYFAVIKSSGSYF